MARPLVLAAASGILATAVTVVTDGTMWLYAWWVVAPGLAVAAVALGIRRHEPSTARPWSVLVAALVLLWIGWTLSAIIGAGLADPVSEATLALVRNLIYLVAYPVLGASSLLLVRARTGGRDRDNVIDAFIAMATVAVLLGAWLFGAGGLSPGVDGLDRAWVVASPLVLAAVLGANVRVVFAGGQRVPAAWLLLLASALTLSGNVWTTTLLRDGTSTVLLGIDILWILGFVAVGSAALHPSMQELTRPLPADRIVAGMPTDRLWLLGTALGAVPMALLRITGAATDSVALAVGGLVIVTLVMWRVRRLLSERDLARRAATDSARNNAVIATVGHWAVDDISTDELLARTEHLLADRFPRIRIVRTERPTGGEAGHDQPAIVTAGVRIATDGVEEPLHEQTFLDVISALLSAAVQRRTAETRLRHDSTHDPLTGLPNRSLALHRLTRLLDERAGEAVAVIFIDLDGFKSVNDTCGHAGGDRVLRDIAHRLRGAVRDTDTVARLAGDEFIVLVPTGDRATLHDLVERLRSAATLPVDGPKGRRTTVNASIGVSTGQAPTITAEELVHRADLAMYAAKQQTSPNRGAAARPVTAAAHAEDGSS